MIKVAKTGLKVETMMEVLYAKCERLPTLGGGFYLAARIWGEGFGNTVPAYSFFFEWR